MVHVMSGFNGAVAQVQSLDASRSQRGPPENGKSLWLSPTARGYSWVSYPQESLGVPQ